MVVWLTAFFYLVSVCSGDDDNVNLTTVTVTLNPKQTYYNVGPGSNIDITCSANCEPPCNYTWYHSNFDSNGSRLTLRNITTALDYNLHGPLLCLAQNEDIGPFTSPEIRIYVQVTVSLNPSTTYYNVRAGSNIDIWCTANCVPSCNYTWYHSNYVSVGGRIALRNITTDLDYNLHGPLLCRASNKEGGPFTSPQIRIYVYDITISVTPKEKVLHVIEGEEFQMNVSAVCFPSCHWLSLNIPNTGYTYVYKDEFTYTKTLNERNNGTWQWKIYNGYYSHYQFQVCVHVVPKPHNLIPRIHNITLDADQCQSLGPIRYIGDCTPYCTYVWFKDDQELYIGNTLYKSFISSHDAGNYYCMAYNRAGNVTSDVFIVTITGDDVQLKPNRSMYRLRVGDEIGPILCSIPTEDNDNTTQWTTPNNKILGSVLHSRNISQADYGTYTCRRTDNYTQECQSTSIVLLNMDTCSLKPSNIYQDLIEKPMFLSHWYGSASVYQVAEGSRLNLRCYCSPGCIGYRWYYSKDIEESQTLSTIINYTMDYTKAGDIYCESWNQCFDRHSIALSLDVGYSPKNVTFWPRLLDTYTVIHGQYIGPINVTADCKPACSYRSWIDYHGSQYGYSLYRKLRGRISRPILQGRWEIYNRYSNVYKHFKINILFHPEEHSLLPNMASITVDITSCNTTIVGPIRYDGVCVPNCTYIWYKDGQPIQYGNTLLLESVSTSDTGSYYCMAYNGAGNTSSDEINITISDDKPYILVMYSQSTDTTISRQRILQSTTGVYECLANCSGFCPVYFKTPTGNLSSPILYLENIGYNDLGEYSCVIDNSTTELMEGCSSNPMFLVKDSCKVEDSKGLSEKRSFIGLDTPLPNVKHRVSLGREFRIDCKATCNETCKQYRWYYPGGYLDAYRFTLNDANYTHDYINGWRLFCVVWDECFNIHASHDILLDIGYGPTTINITAIKSEFVVAEGRSLGPFYCSADCDEPCSVRWRNSRYSYEYYYYYTYISGSTLFIPHVTDNSYKYWRCEVYNSFGSYNSAFFGVIVKYGPRNAQLIPGNRLKYDYRNSSDLELPPIRCTAECDPVCTFVWYKNGKYFSNANVLRIPVVSKYDHGLYHCYGFNYVSNNTFPTVEIIMFDNPSSVDFLPDNATYDLIPGEHLGPINCSADCNPPCEYYWSTPIGNIHGSLLDIEITSPIQGGNYVCHAWNVNYDWTSSNINVNINPCSSINYSPLHGYNQRSSESKISVAIICDADLQQNWYRAGFSDMLVEAPSIFACGTVYPIWLNGTLPAVDETIDAEACVVGYNSDCETSIPVSVKNCGDYRVYHLKPTPVCPAAYCLDDQEAAAPMQMVTMATLSYHDIVWTRTHPKAGAYTTIPSLRFKCSFIPVLDKEMFYQVDWYVNGNKVAHTQTVSPGEAHAGYLLSSALPSLSTNIQCTVSAKKTADGPTGPMKQSPEFFAGIKVTTHNVNVNRGKTTKIFIEQTIPLACVEEVSGYYQPLAFTSCTLSLRVIGEPTLTVCQSCTSITGFYSERDYMNNNGTWQSQHRISLCHQDDGTIDKTITEFDVQLQTGSFVTSNIWSATTSPVFKVKVTEPLTDSWKSRYCFDLLDPHLKTFDGRRYQSHTTGSYLLYRNNATLQEVQVIHKPCFGTELYPKCVCGVAVRAGRDVFIMNICDRNNFIEYTLCDDGALVVKKTSETSYTIYFPTGTSVQVSVRTGRRPYWINMYVYPSQSDQFNTDGLCCSLDADVTNDFKRRYDDVVINVPFDFAYPDLFSESWRLHPEENLFMNLESTYTSLKSLAILNDFVAYCSCGNGPLDFCSYGNSPPGPTYSISTMKCNIKSPAIRSRRKRSIDVLFKDVYMLLGDEYERRHKRSTEQPANISTVMSEENATVICEGQLNSSSVYAECLSTITVMDTSHLESCVADLMMSGDESLAFVALESAIETCSTYTQKNVTLQDTNKAFTSSVLSTCRNNCSGNGVCNEGNCTCNEYYGGADCSFDMRSPPVITYTSDNGTCDHSEDGGCQEISLFGEFFLQESSSTCQVSVNKIHGNNIRQYDGNSTTEGTTRSIFEGQCPLHSDYTNINRNYITEFIITYSNDNNTYSSEEVVIVYDSRCQSYSYNQDGGRVVDDLQNGYCFIDGKCHQNETSDTQRSCFFCNVNSNKYKWTFNDSFCVIDNICHLNGVTKPSSPCHICNTSDQGHYSWSSNTGHCIIDGECYQDGDTKDGTICKFCDSDRDTTSWTVNDTYCFIEDVCYMNKDINGTFPCHVCDVSRNRTNWSENEDYCLIEGVCASQNETESGTPCHICDIMSRHSWSMTPGFCKIKNVCYFNNQRHPNATGSCLTCDVERDTFDWTLNTSYCFINDVCYLSGERGVSSTCRVCNTSDQGHYAWSSNTGHCIIDGECYQDSDIKNGSVCKYCDSDRDTTSWTLNDTYCFIEDVCYMNKDSNGTFPCHVCDVSRNRTNWSENEDYCLIEGVCASQNETESGTPCHICDIMSRHSWLMTPGFCKIDNLCHLKDQSHPNATLSCLICDVDSNISNWTLNTSYCFIDDVCYINGDTRHSFPCHVCNTSDQGHYSWSSNTGHCIIDGECYQDGDTKDRTVCKYCDSVTDTTSWTMNDTYCYIEDACYRNGDDNTTFPCTVCDISRSRTTWSENDGYCLIEGVCTSQNETERGKPCHICDTTSRYSWSLTLGFCEINNVCYFNGQSHPNISGPCLTCDTKSDTSNWTLNTSYCFIEDRCYLSGERRDSFPCHVCNISDQGHYSWSSNTGHCIIDWECYQDGDTKDGTVCKYCDSATDTTSWTMNDTYCYIEDVCYGNQEVNTTYPCYTCDVSTSREKWSENEDYCVINDKCIPSNATEDIKPCHICNTMSRHVWSITPGYCEINGTCYQDGQANSENQCQVCNGSRVPATEWFPLEVNECIPTSPTMDTTTVTKVTVTPDQGLTSTGFVPTTAGPNQDLYKSLLTNPAVYIGGVSVILIVIAAVTAFCIMRKRQQSYIERRDSRSTIQEIYHTNYHRSDNDDIGKFYDNLAYRMLSDKSSFIIPRAKLSVSSTRSPTSN